MTPQQRIQDFLAVKRIAMIGVSRQSNDFSRMLFAEFQKRGYDIVPINPNTEEINGVRCFARLQDATPPVEAALLMTPANVTAQAVRDCVAAGVRRVWMYRGVTQGAVSAEALAVCAEHGIEPVAGECPFMFLPGGNFVHGFHGWWRRLRGAYPAA